MRQPVPIHTLNRRPAVLIYDFLFPRHCCIVTRNSRNIYCRTMSDFDAPGSILNSFAPPPPPARERNNSETVTVASFQLDYKRVGHSFFARPRHWGVIAKTNYTVSHCNSFPRLCVMQRRSINRGSRVIVRPFLQRLAGEALEQSRERWRPRKRTACPMKRP